MTSVDDRDLKLAVALRWLLFQPQPPTSQAVSSELRSAVLCVSLSAASANQQEPSCDEARFLNSIVPVALAGCVPRLSEVAQNPPQKRAPCTFRQASFATAEKLASSVHEFLLAASSDKSDHVLPACCVVVVDRTEAGFDALAAVAALRHRRDLCQREEDRPWVIRDSSFILVQRRESTEEDQRNHLGSGGPELQRGLPTKRQRTHTSNIESLSLNSFDAILNW
jgi:hypothetical protein